MSRNLSRRRPFPYDMSIGGAGVMLRPDPQTGVLMNSPKVQPLSSSNAPTQYDYSSQPPYNERTHEFRRLIMGMGSKVQAGDVVRNYRYALGIDTSINGFQILGPEVNGPFTAATAAPIRDFVEALDGGVLKLWVAAGRYVLKTTDGVTWTSSRDAGAGKQFQQMHRFQAPSGSDTLVATNDANEVHGYNGAAWSTGSVTGGFVEANGNEIWIAKGNQVYKATADSILDVANYSALYDIGDKSSNITWLSMLNNSLIIFKESGVYSINPDGSANDLFPGLRAQRDPTNGRAASIFLNDLFFHFGDSFWDLSFNSNSVVTINAVGVERLIENDSEVRGRVLCSAAHENWFDYLALYNSETGDSYLLKFGAWLSEMSDADKQLGYLLRLEGILQRGASAGATFVPAIHGALAKIAGQKITAMTVSAIPGPNLRLYIGTDAGLIYYIILPRNTPNPLADTSCRFATTGTTYWPLHTAMWQADTKAWRGATPFGPVIDSTRYLTLEYRTNPISGAWTALGGNFQSNAQRQDFPTGTASKAIDVRNTLVGPGSSTPVVEGIALHEAIRPDLVLERDFAVIAQDYVALRNGATDRKSAEHIREIIKRAVDSAGAIAVVLPDETATNLQFVDYAEALPADQKRGPLAFDLTVKAIEFKSNTTFGTIGRLSGRLVGDLAPYTVGALTSI